MNVRGKTAGFIVAFMLASAACSAIAAPRATSDDAQAVDKARAAIAANAEKALAKQGGSKILFKVDSAALREAVVTELRDDVYRTVREGRIPFSGLAMRDGGVEVRIAEPKDRQRVLAKLVPSAKESPSGARTISVTDSDDGLIRLMPTEAGFAERLRELVTQSGEMIDQRLRNAGIRDASQQPDGADRLRVLLPGVRDPERVSALLSKRGRVTFRLVDVSVIAALAQKGPLPPTSEVLYHFKTREPSVVLKEIAMEGDDIIDASPLIDPRTQQPIASLRLNARGARRFATITQENITKPFAIVVDDQVLSESIISEPITGGSAIISGNFTIEDANNVAMLVRSGALPGRLSVVDQQVVEPVATAGKQ
ncbi:SecDF P1 head subdomain-containing protein [Bradyrhizobium sp. AUGA SZCCT0431]|uniref:SecDF P1 head subdomain-containing protein n=1 Tax=Bradyrhizobium sp. AUGA SZCCT0431 TaxID=2807674 RepID=UPI002013271D|nr:preprotein translocase subunit SecD [Bradyrhizobium sp. AUGA SZCCT0431]